jgi:hypothetical protein
MQQNNDGNVWKGVAIGLALSIPGWAMLALLLALGGCYPAASWCTKERPCTGDPVTRRDTTVVTDTTGGTHGR